MAQAKMLCDEEARILQLLVILKCDFQEFQERMSDIPEIASDIEETRVEMEMEIEAGFGRTTTSKFRLL